MPRSPWILPLLLAVLAAGCGGGAAHLDAARSSATPVVRSAERPAWQHLVARSKTMDVVAYRHPSERAARTVLRPAEFDRGAPTYFVLRTTPDWVQVLLPSRPNGSTGWVRASSTSLVPNSASVVVDTAHRRLVARVRRQVIANTQVVVGAPGTPTPRGRFFIVNRVRLLEPAGPYGPYALGLSAHSDALTTFNGKDAQIALHGTNEPELLGSAVSNGCIRMPNAVILRLVARLPKGTPVTIT